MEKKKKKEKERERKKRKQKYRDNYFKHHERSHECAKLHGWVITFAGFVRGRGTQRDPGAFTQLLDITALGIGNSTSSLPINA